MGYDDGIVIDVGYPCARPDCLDDLVGIVGSRQAAAYVDELADARFAGQVAYRAPQEAAVSRQAISASGSRLRSSSAASRSAAKLSFPPRK